MKFKITFKTPDVLDQIERFDEAEDIKEITGKFIKYGEYVTLEFDTETQTCQVVPVK